ncbi:MAG: hypothetical protein ABJD07_16970, partial [Gemmatimonadaceae bacterium]
MRGNRIWIAVQIAFVALVLFFVARALQGQWLNVGERVRLLRPDWTGIGAGSLLVLGAYAILVQTWRLMLAAWNAPLSPREATVVWFVSNLAKYVPGGIWQITALGAMAQRRGVSTVAAAGSSLAVNLINIITGFLVVFATGSNVLATWRPGATGVAIALAVVLALGAL